MIHVKPTFTKHRESTVTGIVAEISDTSCSPYQHNCTVVIEIIVCTTNKSNPCICAIAQNSTSGILLNIVRIQTKQNRSHPRLVRHVVIVSSSWMEFAQLPLTS